MKQDQKMKSTMNVLQKLPIISESKLENCEGSPMVVRRMSSPMQGPDSFSKMMQKNPSPTQNEDDSFQGYK